MTARYEKGMQTRRTVLGDAHVNRAEANKTQFDEPFQTLITEGAWGMARATARSLSALCDVCAQVNHIGAATHQ